LGDFFVGFYVNLLLSFSIILLIPSVSASSPWTIDEEEAWGYQYVVTKENDTFTWEIGYQVTISTTEENKGNAKYLHDFRVAVNDSDVHLLTIVLSGIYLFIVVITAFIIYKKNKQMLKKGWGILAILAGIALYYTFFTYLNLDVA
jgi:hypothetical protein